ncbi:AAA family ATPase [Roseiconus nitratireducens]|uniref:AAA family ATPase n=1 Tax=Roseiconus nitratireducens TaxID=2605748 RepID=A0A5M6D160_9BACT|nr:AAA family ATPase [Roseiconus nitratireducens]KAA5541043.1 AAA family ATPase [Roseiconus nitratireducens]
MKVKDLQIDGFGVWTGLSIDSLPDGMTLFYGPNEAGKTTVMQFLRSMLYGFTPERREKYLPPLYGGTPGGAIRVTGPGGGYQIRRHAQMTDSSVTGQLTVTGQDGLVQGQHRLSMLLGQIDEPIFTNVFAIGMRELQELNTLDDTAAADELYKLSSGLDRVSLVDVIRSLREGRKSLVGGSAKQAREDADKLDSLLRRREQLRDEVQKLTGQSRRWSELASLRQTQQQEINDLGQRIAAWEKEARHVEAAVNVFDPWQKRRKLREEIKAIEAETHLPDEAPGQLVQIEALIDERRKKLDEVKQKRRELRDKAAQLPVSQRMLELQGRIEAATEQATWVEALEEQIAKVDTQIGKARGQLATDAERLGLSDEDRESLLDGDLSQMPDLSRQTLSALAGPAKRVKEQLFLLKQARAEGLDYKKRIDQYEEELGEVLQRTRSADLQQAIREENEHLASLRRRMQLGEHIEKIKRHYRSLENESVDLSTAEVLPLDRLLLMGLPFVVGGCCLIVAFSHLLGLTWFLAGEPTPTAGMLWLFFGAMSLAVYFLSKQNGQRSTAQDREDCDRQIDTLRRQIRELEAERDEVDSDLPGSSQPIEFRVRQAELLLADLEATMPSYHAHAAAKQSYEAARAKAVKAAEQLKAARREWTSTLKKLGLADSMSPRSVRKLSEGYETVQSSLRRLEELQAEKDQRVRERQGLAKRIESLYLESLEVNEDDRKAQRQAETATSEKRSDRDPSRPPASAQNEASEAPSPRRVSRVGPLEQLNHLQEELARQQHWIKRRRDLKEQDAQLKRQHAAHARAIERGEQQRRTLWAKCGVATAEQFYEMVDSKASLVELREQWEAVDKQIRSMISGNLSYDDVAEPIEGSSQSALEKRWDLLTTRVAETQERIATLRTQQGELAADMKHLAEDNRLMVAQLELGCVNRKIDGVAQRWQILATASCLVEEVCGKFERERQPETLREASSFLGRLTDGKYTRIWTPLGTNQLKIDSADGKDLPLEVLSRGTREAVFIALRLSLAAAYARRGVMLPLVLDDVLVNFDGDRALHAADTLRMFAELGHQVLMFTCHDHIVEIFHSIGVEVRQLPAQGKPGRATVLLPEEVEDIVYEEPEPIVEEPEYEEELVVEEPLPEEPGPEPEPELELEPEPEPEPVQPPPPKVVVVEKTRPAPPPRTVVKTVYVPREPEPPREPPEPEPSQGRPQPAIGWAWFEREPADGKISTEERAAKTLNAAHRAINDEWFDDQADPEDIPEEIWNRNNAWWDGSRVTT